MVADIVYRIFPEDTPFIGDGGGTRLLRQLLRQLIPSFSVPEIAKMLGTRRKRVRIECKIAGIKVPRGRRPLARRAAGNALVDFHRRHSRPTFSWRHPWSNAADTYCAARLRERYLYVYPGIGDPT